MKQNTVNLCCTQIQNIKHSSMALALTHSLAQMSIRNYMYFWEVNHDQRVRLIISSSSSRLSRKCGISDISQPYRPLQPVVAIALLVVQICCSPKTPKIRFSMHYHKHCQTCCKISLSLFLSVFCAACQCFKTLFSVLNTCHF
jgi:hypothetical protein